MRRGGVGLFLAGMLTALVIVALSLAISLLLTGCATAQKQAQGRPFERVDGEGAAMLKAAGLDPTAVSEDPGVPPLLIVATYLAHYGAEIVPVDHKLATLSWCPPPGGSIPAGYDLRLFQRVPADQDALTPWLDRESIRVLIPADCDSTWGEVRSVGATGLVSDWTAACAYGDTCGDVYDCGPESYEVPE